MVTIGAPPSILSVPTERERERERGGREREGESGLCLYKGKPGLS